MRKKITAKGTLEHAVDRRFDPNELAKKDALRAKGKAMLALADAEGRDFTDDEVKEFDATIAAIDNISQGRRSLPDDMVIDTQDPTRRRWVGDDAAESPIPFLAKSDKLGAHVRKQRGSPEFERFDSGGKITAGEIIKSFIVGSDDGTKFLAASGGSLTSGGFLLSPELSADIIDLARAASTVIRAGAVTVPMTTSELHMVRVTGDPSLGWYGENQTISTGDPTFGRITFTARKCAVIVKISRELVADAPNASMEIERQLAVAMANEIDRVALVGTGAGAEPRGIFNHPDVLTTGSVAALSYDDLLDSWKLIADQNGEPNAFITHPLGWVTLAKAKEAGTNAFLTPPSALQPILMLRTTQLASSQAVIGDFRKVMIGIRAGIEVEVSTQAGDGSTGAFTDDQLWCKARWRGDVQLAIPDHLATLTGITA